MKGIEKISNINIDHFTKKKFKEKLHFLDNFFSCL